MNWDILKSSLEGLQTRGTNLQQKIRGLRRRLTLAARSCRAGADHLKRRQRCGRYRDVFAGRGAVWLCTAVVADSHDHRAVRNRRNVRAHGRDHRQRVIRSHSRRVWLPPYVFCDGHGILCRPSQRRCGVCRRGCVDGNVSRQQVHRCSYSRDIGLDSCASRYISPSRGHLPDRVRVLRHIHHFRDPGQARLAGGCQARCHSQPSIQFWLFTDAHGSGGNDHRPVAILLLASGFRGEKGRTEAVSAGAC